MLAVENRHFDIWAKAKKGSRSACQVPSADRRFAATMRQLAAKSRE
jgi:hypothetical protein